MELSDKELLFIKEVMKQINPTTIEGNVTRISIWTKAENELQNRSDNSNGDHHAQVDTIEGDSD